MSFNCSRNCSNSYSRFLKKTNVSIGNFSRTKNLTGEVFRAQQRLLLDWHQSNTEKENSDVPPSAIHLNSFSSYLFGERGCVFIRKISIRILLLFENTYMSSKSKKKARISLFFGFILLENYR